MQRMGREGRTESRKEGRLLWVNGCMLCGIPNEYKGKYVICNHIGCRNGHYEIYSTSRVAAVRLFDVGCGMPRMKDDAKLLTPYSMNQWIRYLKCTVSYFTITFTFRMT